MPNKKKPSKPRASSKQAAPSSYKDLLTSSRFGRVYAIAAVGILVITTLLWSIMGAKVQAGNADQLVNPYLFSSAATLKNAYIPGAHSFLMKWPLFLLIKLLDFSGNAYLWTTVTVVLVTVLVLVAIIYKIERRPLVFGTLCLALASMLLLVPAQPYAGGILPVNMAMLTTRNLEYALYLISLIVLIKSPRLRSWQFWLATALMSILMASDKLFLILGLAAAGLALVFYSLTRGWALVSLAVHWVISSGLAALGAIIILALISYSHLTHIASQAAISPYGVVDSTKNLVLGGLYAFLGMLTNFGANPAFDATKVSSLPHDAFSRLFSISGPSYLINLVLLALGVYMVYRLIMLSLKRHFDSGSELDFWSRLSLMLIWSTAVAVAVFMFSSHYYAVDARYLTIGVFALFVTAATFTRQRNWRAEQLALVGLIITIGMGLGLYSVFHSYNAEQVALSGVNQRDSEVAQILTTHHVDTLVGDYWRVIPTKFVAGGNKLNVTPLANCTILRDSLSSTTWQPNLYNHSFAYLLTSSGSLTDYPNCQLNQIVNAYGHPNASFIVAGSYLKPQEELLFYDHGIHNSTPKTADASNKVSTVTPIALSDLANTACDVPTDMNIVAHEDDDLLFMNPDILEDIQAGNCVRTVYITAGDAGFGVSYWIGRQQGAEAAYSYMLGFKGIWVQRIVELTASEFITVANPRGNTQVSLIFMNLPDGNLKGNGFSSTHFESLAKLLAGQITTMTTVDNQSSYTASQLTAALTMLMHAYQPAEIRTQADFVSQQFPDHSDHIAVGQFVDKAYKAYETQQYDNQVTIPLDFYLGYPVRQFATNVSGNLLSQKEAAFLAYAQYDGAVCRNLAECLQTPTYNGYLAREYQQP